MRGHKNALPYARLLALLRRGRRLPPAAIVSVLARARGVCVYAYCVAHACDSCCNTWAVVNMAVWSTPRARTIISARFLHNSIRIQALKIPGPRTPLPAACQPPRRGFIALACSLRRGPRRPAAGQAMPCGITMGTDLRRRSPEVDEAHVGVAHERAHEHAWRDSGW